MTNALQTVREVKTRRNDYDGVFFVGRVVDNKDPEQTERVRVRVDNLWGDAIKDADLPWARPVRHHTGGGPSKTVHSISVPIIGSLLVVVLQNGDPYHPLYLGGLLTSDQLHEVLTTNYPERYGFRDAHDNHLWVDGSTGEAEFRHHSGLRVHTNDDGRLTIEVPENAVISVVGDASLSVGGNADVSVDGNATTAVGGNASVSVDGTANVNVDGNTTLTVGGSLSASAQSVTVSSAAAASVNATTVSVTGTAAVTLTSAAVVNIVAPAINLG